MLIVSCLLIGLLSLTELQAATIVIGSPSASNVLPFGEPNLFGLSEYQEVYTSNSFSDLRIKQIAINMLGFYPASPSVSVASGTYQFSLSTTSKMVGGLDSADLSGNIGPDNRLFFSGSLAGPVQGATLNVSGGPFVYTPSAGNLLMTILYMGPGQDILGFAGAFLRGPDPSSVSSAVAIPTLGPNNFAGGLVTAISGDAVFFPAPVPEPKTSMLTLIGFVMLFHPTIRHARRG